MKARDYYKKYGTRLLNEETKSEVSRELLNEFIVEFKALIEARHIKTDKGVLKAIEDMNSTWNALCRKFDHPVLRENAFRSVMYEQLGVNRDLKKAAFGAYMASQYNGIPS